jgi:hypothetical protein
MEGFFLFLGLVGSAIMALLKITTVISVGWLACLIPLAIAIVLVALANGMDIWD